MLTHKRLLSIPRWYVFRFTFGTVGGICLLLLPAQFKQTKSVGGTRTAHRLRYGRQDKKCFYQINMEPNEYIDIKTRSHLKKTTTYIREFLCFFTLRNALLGLFTPYRRRQRPASGDTSKHSYSPFYNIKPFVRNEQKLHFPMLGQLFDTSARRRKNTSVDGSSG